MSDSAVIWTNGLITPDPDAAGSDSGTVAGSQNNSIHTVKSHCDNTTRDGRAYDQEIGEPGQAGEYIETLINVAELESYNANAILHHTGWITARNWTT